MDKYQVLISHKAQLDLTECISFVLRVSVESASKLADDIYSTIQSLETFPERNPIFEMPKTFPFQIRKQVICNRYIALYAIENNNVVVHRILDSRRKFDFLLS